MMQRCVYSPVIRDKALLRLHDAHPHITSGSLAIPESVGLGVGMFVVSLEDNTPGVPRHQIEVLL
jgi:hypothetical protein